MNSTRRAASSLSRRPRGEHRRAGRAPHGVAICTFLVVLCTGALSAPAAVRDCSNSRIRTALITRGELARSMGNIDRQLATHDARLKTLSREIRSVRASSGTNPLKRRRLEQLLRESRTHARDMERLNNRRGAIALQLSSIEDDLRVCLSDSLVTSLRVLVDHVRARRFDDAGKTMTVIRELEGVLAQLRGEPDTGAYPEFSDAFVEDALANPSDRLFLADAIEDLFERAVADSARHARRLETTRENLELKRDLLRLIGEAGESSFDGSSFFESFGDDQVRADISRLEAQETALEAALAESERAAAYYRERLHRLRTQTSTGD